MNSKPQREYLQARDAESHDSPLPNILKSELLGISGAFEARTELNFAGVLLVLAARFHNFRSND